MHFCSFEYMLKGLVHPKCKILSLITHPHVVSNPWDLRSSSEHKLRYFWCILRALWPSIDSKGPYTIKVQKRSKEIGEIIHVTSGVQFSNRNFTKLQDYFLYAKETKITTLFNSLSPLRQRSAILENIRWTETAYALLCQPHRTDTSSTYIYALIWTKTVHPVCG